MGSEASQALIVVDVQNDFVDPSGSLYVRDAENAVSSINARISAARDEGRFIVYTQDWHPEVTPHFEKDGGIWPVHCVGGTWGAELYPELLTADGAEVVRKGVDGEDGYSGFSVRDAETGASSATRLESLLRGQGVTDVTVIGIATDYCVKETALDALRLGFNTTIVLSCMRGVDLQPGDSEAAVAAMANAGARVLNY